MGMLSGPEILVQINQGNIVIDPFDAKRLNPNSYNLTLAPELLVYEAPLIERNDQLLLFSNDWTQGAATPAFDGRIEGVPYWEQTCAVLDMKKDNACKQLLLPEHGAILFPGVLYLASTNEYTETRGFVPCIEGRSSVGRLGMCVHVTAGFGDDGFQGTWTLEITVVHPIRVYPNVPICQIAYSQLVGERQPYRGKYSGQRGPKPSGFWKEFIKKDVA